VSFSAIKFDVASQRVFVFVYFVIDSVRKLMDTHSHVAYRWTDRIGCRGLTVIIFGSFSAWISRTETTQFILSSKPSQTWTLPNGQMVALCTCYKGLDSEWTFRVTNLWQNSPKADWIKCLFSDSVSTAKYVCRQRNMNTIMHGKWVRISRRLS